MGAPGPCGADQSCIGKRALDAARMATRPRGHVTGDPSVREAAECFGVSVSEVAHAKRFLRVGSADVIAAVESGRLSVYSALKIARYPAAEQEMVLARALDAKGTQPRMPEGAVQGVPRVSRCLPRRDPMVVIERAITAMEQNAVMATPYLRARREPLDAETRKQWGAIWQIVRRFFRDALDENEKKEG